MGKTVRKKVLCVIDLQGEHWADDLKKPLEEIRAAKRRRHTIVVVEYEYRASRPTCAKLIKALGRYRYLHVKKLEPDGSGEILAALEHAGVEPVSVSAFGHHTTCCVLRTVEGLRQRLGVARVGVVVDCCYPPNMWNEKLLKPELQQEGTPS